jgi:hypothetical protein
MIVYQIEDYAHVCVVPNTGSKSTWYMCSAGSPGEENEKEGGESRSTEGGEKLVLSTFARPYIDNCRNKSFWLM